jgi:hypothetical protein
MRVTIDNSILNCMKNIHMLSFFCLLLLALTEPGFAQTKKEYHFVYIDVSASDRENLQAYLEKFYAKVGDQKCVFFLSNQNKPVIATDKKSFELLEASISNISILNLNALSDLEQINKVMSKDDFLHYDNSQLPDKKLKCLYDRVVMHFFLDPGSFNSFNLNKYLIQRLLAINYFQKDVQPIHVEVYFDAEALKTTQLKNQEIFSNNDFNLVKY